MQDSAGPGTAAGTKRELAVLDGGKVFGEAALMDPNHKSTLNIIAGHDGCVCYSLGKGDFERLLKSNLQAAFEKLAAKRERAKGAPAKPKYRDLELRRILGVGTFGRVKLVVRHASTVY